MSGPIIRSGASPEYAKNWDQAFAASKPKSTSKSASASTGEKKQPEKKAKSAKKPKS